MKLWDSGEQEVAQLRQTILFLAESQRTWLSFFPQMSRRAQQDIAAYLCVRRRQGCQFGELSGYIKQNFLLDEATIKDRIRDAIAESQVTIDPESLSSRTFVIPSIEFLAHYDRFLDPISALLGPATGQPRLGGAMDAMRRETLTTSTTCHVEYFEQAVDGICAERGMSRARSLETRRSLQSISHWTLLRMVMETALLPSETGAPDILADDLAASLLGLIRQNFQTTRDHINGLIGVGIFERRGGKTLHVGLTAPAALHFRVALTKTAGKLAQLAQSLTAAVATADLTVEFSKDHFKPPPSGPTAHALRISGPGLAPFRVELEPETIIGRTAPSTLLLPGQSVSRTHCRIDIAAPAATLTDLASTNGTRLHGARITTPTRLQHGDEIGAGDYTLTFEMGPKPNKP